MITEKAWALLLLILTVSCIQLQAQDRAKSHTPWELKGADERIEKVRKGEITLKFELPDGATVSDEVPVQMELKKHAFHFGISAGQTRAIKDEVALEKYRKYVGEISNYMTVGLYWVLVEQEKGRKIEPDYIRSMLQWAADKQMTVKGHPMLWHQSLPRWLFEMTNPEEVDEIVQDHIRYLITHYPEIDQWDVYNEAVAAYKSHVPENGIVRWVTYKEGVNPAVEFLFSLANEINPDKFYINNHYTHTHPEFKELNELLISKGINFGAIGLQTHMHQKPNILSENELWDMLEDYSQFDKPIHLTEMTFLSSEPFKDWKAMQEQEKKTSRARRRGELAPLRPSTPEYEQIQADYLRDFYTLAFSHPSVEAIVYWNATDLSAWRGTASGFLDVNCDPKPSFYALRELIREKWHTSVLDKTAGDGTVTFKGFYGRYEGTATLNDMDYSFSFPHLPNDSDDPVTVKLKP